MEGKVIILGNDHTNTVGLLQSLGEMGIELTAAIWGQKSGLTKSCRYTKKIITGHTPQECIDKIVALRDYMGATIIPGCDLAASCLEENKDLLKDFKFQYSLSKYTIAQLQEKNLQVDLAAKSGFNVPKTWELRRKEDIPADIEFPCLIKPLVSTEGSKDDLLVSWNIKELNDNLDIVLARTPRVLIQQFIQKDFDFIVHGVALKNCDVIVKGIIRKDLIYPLNVGLSSYCTLLPLNGDNEIIQSIKNFIKGAGYVGLFSTEFMRSKLDGKLYFCENNFRNDGKIAITKKAGLNLPFIHFCDLNDMSYEIGNIEREYHAIWEMHHFQSLIHRNISFRNWIRQISSADIFMVFDRKDYKPIFRQFVNFFKFKMVKPRNY